MTHDIFNFDRRFLIPEVIQTSAMDCGPAALKALLGGFDISVSYGRLREACQTDVDGTSIDVMEEVAYQLGLDIEQVIVPVDHLLLSDSESLPAIVIVQLPNGLTHFVVVWSKIGSFVQVMDPATGRRWPSQKRFLDELYVHVHPIPSDVWREWAGDDGFCEPLRHRLRTIAGELINIEPLIDEALEDDVWYSLATLDATTRMIEALIQANGLEHGEEAVRVLKRFFERVQAETPGESKLIPDMYWLVKPSHDDKEILLMKGAILVRALGHCAPNELQDVQEDEEAQEENKSTLSPELIASLKEESSHPEQAIFNALREDGLLAPIALTFALFLATTGVVIEALLLRGLLDIGQSLNLVGQRIGAISALFTFLIALVLLEWPISSIMFRMGRHLEIRLRMALHKKIPLLGDRYFHSRLTSDMTQRAYDLRQLRTLPTLGINFLRVSFQIALTAVGIAWLDIWNIPLAILMTVVAISVAFLGQPILLEQDLRLRTHIGALSRFYLDALLGLIPIRTHRAEKAVRRQHEDLLVEWYQAGMRFYNIETFFNVFEALLGSLFAIWIVFSYISRGGEASSVLLLFYWALNLPNLAEELATLAQQYPIQRNKVLRLIEPLDAPEETEGFSDNQTKETTSVSSSSELSKGMNINMQDVTVQAGGHVILTDINLDIKSGDHIAIVGPSGAGKSSLVGLLLGWYQSSTGSVMADGINLKNKYLHTVRRQIAWLDPSVQIWNRSLFDNLRYGTHTDDEALTQLPIEKANLFDILEKLPDGLQTVLGESGGLVSGGEGQRVRLGRALFRKGVRLAILDEPFRGLDRVQRQELLVKSRQHWKDNTLIFISHDVNETKSFGRVIVIENGRLIEDDTPDNLIAQANSRYLALLQAEEAVRKGMWSTSNWRRLWLANGKVSERKTE